MNSRLQLRFASLKKNNFLNKKSGWSKKFKNGSKYIKKYLDILKMLLTVCYQRGLPRLVFVEVNLDGHARIKPMGCATLNLPTIRVDFLLA